MYYKLTYTNDIPDDCAEEVWAWFIKIKPEEKHDESLLAHALVHVSQFWRTSGLHIFLRWNDSYRLKCEVEAYKVQLRYAPGNEMFFAERLATMYGFNISKEEALKLLK